MQRKRSFVQLAHTSPHHGHSVLGPASAQGAIALAVHPAMSFSGTSLDLQRMREVFFAVSAPKVVLPIAQALVIEMGGEPVVIAEQQRAAEREGVAVDDPRQVRLRGPELPLDRGQSDVDDRGVQHQDHLGQGQHGEREQRGRR